jgi:peptidoglycan/xylan/chitin deacetylase (PgdA/CDA1 family)
MSTPLALFLSHINTIKEEGYELVSEITKEYGQVKIQFDDGFRGLYDCIEELKDIPIEVFLVTDYIGKEGYLSISEIKELATVNVAFSSHSCSHKDLPTCSTTELIYELKESKRQLEELLGHEIKALCYPRGLFSHQVIEAAKAANYKKQYSSLPGSYHNQVFPQVYRRNLVQFLTKNELKHTLRGGQLIFFKRYFKRQYSQ